MFVYFMKKMIFINKLFNFYIYLGTNIKIIYPNGFHVTNFRLLILILLLLTVTQIKKINYKTK